jgi:CDP-paratose 2-epimerase
MRILITGVCGFVGSTLAECLIERVTGIRVVGVDSLIRPGAETNRIRLARLGVEFIHSDLRSASDVDAWPACDWVIDAAANPSVLAGLGDAGSSRRWFEHNVTGLGNVLEYCRAHTAGLLLISSSRVYSIAALASLPMTVADHAYTLDSAQTLPEGVSSRGLGTEFSTTPPLSLYGAGKRASEILALEYGVAFGFPVWIDRCGVLAGAGQFGTAEQGIFSYWINAHLRRRPLRYIGFEGHGYQARDAFHPADLATLLLRQIESNRSGGSRVYTVGGGPENCLSLAQLTKWCDHRFGTHPVARDLRPRPFDIPWVAMDSSAAQKDFGWSPTLSLGEILEGIANHAEQNPQWLEISGAA